MASLACATHASHIVSPIAVSDNSLGTNNENTKVVNLINQSGLATHFTSGTTYFDDYFASNPDTSANPATGNNWQSLAVLSLPLTGYLDFDLGESLSINRIAIWNISLKDIQIELLDDPFGSGTAAGSFQLQSHLTTTTNYPAQILELTQPTTGRYVRLLIHSAYTLPPPNHSFAFATAGEIAVGKTPPPPRTCHPPHTRRPPRGSLLRNTPMGRFPRRGIHRCRRQSHQPARPQPR